MFPGPFPGPNFALSHCDLSSSESPSDPISSSAKLGQPHMHTRLPIYYQGHSHHNDCLLGPDDLGFGYLEPTPVRIEPALARGTNRCEGQFQSIPALLPSPLEDADSPPPDRPSDLTTPTPTILHNKISYFGQDALEMLKQKRPARKGLVPHLPQNSTRRMAPRHDIAPVDLPSNFQGINSPCISSSS